MLNSKFFHKYMIYLNVLILTSMLTKTLTIKAQGTEETNDISNSDAFIVSLPKNIDVSNNETEFNITVTNNNNYDIQVDIPTTVNLINIRKKSELIPINVIYSNETFKLNESRKVNLYHDNLTAGYWTAVLSVKISATKKVQENSSPQNEVIDSNIVDNTENCLKQFSITYILNEGKFISDVSSCYSENIGIDSLPMPIREGYEFVGWKLGDEIVSSISPELNKDIEIEAEWKIQEQIDIVETSESEEKNVIENNDSNMVNYENK